MIYRSSVVVLPVTADGNKYRLLVNSEEIKKYFISYDSSFNNNDKLATTLAAIYTHKKSLVLDWHRLQHLCDEETYLTLNQGENSYIDSIRNDKVHFLVWLTDDYYKYKNQPHLQINTEHYPSKEMVEGLFNSDVLYIGEDGCFYLVDTDNPYEIGF